MQRSQSTFHPYCYHLPDSSDNVEHDRPFSFKQLYRHPGSLKEYDRRGSRKRIAIIGGGIAGLSSAYELDQLGHHVTLLESSDRLGGRIRTHYFSDGTYSELGAMRIPTSHGCVMHYVETFELPKQNFVSYNPAAFYHLRGSKSRLDAFSQLFAAYKLSTNERQDPGVVYDTLLEELIDTLQEDEKWQMFLPTFTSNRLKRYGDITFTQYFRDRLSPDAFEFVGHATGMIHYDRVSLLGGLIDFFAWYRVEQCQLVGGMETLVKAFVERLQESIQCNVKVTGIQMTDTAVCVHWNHLDQRKIQEFDYVICTVPNPALANIEFNPPLSADKMQAIRSLRYSSAVKTLFHCTARPWELYDDIYGGGSFTDLTIEKCWYPSDNARLVSGKAENPLWVAHDRDISHQPAAFTAAYRWESNAQHFLTLEDEQRTDSTIQEVQQLHTHIKQYVDEIVHYVWDEEANPGSGAYAFFAPGEHEQFQGLLCQPYPSEAPRVFFAGEHLAINHASIQGAVQTALAAAIAVLKAPTSQNH